QNVDKGNQAAVDGRSSEPAGVPVGPETSTEATQTSPQPEIHPVMSFFKTLVNKPGPKTEEEAKSDVEDKVGGRAGCADFWLATMEFCSLSNEYWRWRCPVGHCSPSSLVFRG
ncbi:hypothetical protein AB205_0110990, partial [Aquarana catesbeiana]